MLKKSIFVVLYVLLFLNCKQEKSDIRVVCEATPPGYYRIKWETFPPMEGTVKFYESSVPDSFNLYSPIAEAKISRGFMDIFYVRSTKRSYFKLVFNKNHSVITAERIIPMDGLSNFRDLGGYYNTSGKQTRWGKFYRSSSLSKATFYDIKVLNNLGLRTVIDFRTDKERYDAPPKYIAPIRMNLPLRGNPYRVFFDRILSKKWKAGDAKIYVQDMFSFLLENNSDYFIKMFDILLDEKNYPVLINCTSGHDRSAVASALILAALGVEMDQIVNDYLLTNEQNNFNSFFSDDNILLEDPEVQETFTALFKVHKSTITYSFERIIKEYETIDNFLNTKLNLTDKKREKLKELLLY